MCKQAAQKCRSHPPPPQRPETKRLAELGGRRHFGRQPWPRNCCCSGWEGQRAGWAGRGIGRTANEAGGGRSGRPTLPFSQTSGLEQSLWLKQLGRKKRRLLSHNFNFVSVERNIYTPGCLELNNQSPNSGKAAFLTLCGKRIRVEPGRTG